MINIFIFTMEFQCDVCNKTFSRQSNLNRHKLSVHGSSCFSCAKCDKTFNRKDAFLRHQNTCSLKCKYCETNFQNKTDLVLHEQCQHQGNNFKCGGAVVAVGRRRYCSKLYKKGRTRASSNHGRVLFIRQ